MRKTRQAVWSVVGVLGIATAAWGAPIYHIATLGLNADPQATVGAVNEAGQAAGITTVITTDGDQSEYAYEYTGQQSVPIGLTGGKYDFNDSGSINHTDSVVTINNNGQVIGASDVYDGIGEIIGKDSWIYSGGTTTLIGLTGGIYQPSIATTNNGASLKDGAKQLNDNGQVIGTSLIFNSSGNIVGQDAWFYSGDTTTLIGLQGGAYQGMAGGSVEHFGTAVQLNAAGQVIGTSGIYNSTGANVGNDAWIYSGGTSTQIGFTGAGYQLPLTGGGFVRHSTPVALNSSGQVIGFSLAAGTSSFGLGQDAWIYSGGSLQQIGLTGGVYAVPAFNGQGIQRSTTPMFLNNNGQAVGTSAHYDSDGLIKLGQDSWIYSGGTTKQIGLIGGIYEDANPDGTGGFARASTPLFLNNNGQVAGTSTIFNSQGRPIGTDSWIYSGGATTQIGLIGGPYEIAFQTSLGGGIARTSTVTGLSNNGYVVGYSDLTTTPNAQDGWLYNANTNTTVEIQNPNVESDNGFRYTDPLYVSDSGNVIGIYDQIVGNTNEEQSLFWWNQNDGFFDLGSLVKGGLNANGWSELENIQSPPPGSTLLAVGDMPDVIGGTGFLSTGIGGQAAFLLNLPEPTMIAPLALGLLILRRRSRATVSV